MDSDVYSPLNGGGPRSELGGINGDVKLCRSGHVVGMIASMGVKAPSLVLGRPLAGEPKYNINILVVTRASIQLCASYCSRYAKYQ